MTAKVIRPEEFSGELRQAFYDLMGTIVPSNEKHNLNLQRLIAFRLQTDGFAATRAYLKRKIKRARECAYTGDLFLYLRDDREEQKCGAENPDPPDAA